MRVFTVFFSICAGINAPPPPYSASSKYTSNLYVTTLFEARRPVKTFAVVQMTQYELQIVFTVFQVYALLNSVLLDIFPNFLVHYYIPVSVV